MLVTFAQYCVEFYLNIPKNDPDRFFRTHSPHQGIDQQIPLFPSQSRNERSGAVSERVGWHHL